MHIYAIVVIYIYTRIHQHQHTLLHLPLFFGLSAPDFFAFVCSGGFIVYMYIYQPYLYLYDRPLDNTPRTTAKIHVYTQNSLFSHAKIRFLELALQTPPE